MTSLASPKELVSTPFPAEFLCIGAQKACTSWLNLVLKSDLNESIFIPYIKETFYLNLVEGQNETYPPPEHSIESYAYPAFRQATEDEIRVQATKLLDGNIIPQEQAAYIGHLCESLCYYWTGLNADWYNHLFSAAKPGQLRGEINPDYSFLGKEMIKSLCKAKPSLKILLITRDPIARDLSQLKMQLLPRIPNPTDQQCIDFLGQSHVRKRSEYWNIVQRWSNVFGGNSVMTIDAKHIAADPGSAIRRISMFLNVELQIRDSTLLTRDNVSRSTWLPSEKVLSFLEKYYDSCDVYGDLDRP